MSGCSRFRTRASTSISGLMLVRTLATSPTTTGITEWRRRSSGVASRLTRMASTPVRVVRPSNMASAKAMPRRVVVGWETSWTTTMWPARKSRWATAEPMSPMPRTGTRSATADRVIGPPLSREVIRLLHEDPFRPEQWEGNQTDHRRDSHEQGIAHFPAEQDDQADERDQPGEPVPDRDLGQEHAGSEDRPDRRGVGALD